MSGCLFGRGVWPGLCALALEGGMCGSLSGLQHGLRHFMSICGRGPKVLGSIMVLVRL